MRSKVTLSDFNVIDTSVLSVMNFSVKRDGDIGNSQWG